MILSLSPFGDLLRDSPTLKLRFYIMTDFRKYELTINVRTNKDPRGDLWRIVNKIKDLMPVLSIDYHLIDDRPTSDEHHGGVINESNT